MASEIIRDLVIPIRENWYTIILGETTDVSNVEELVICLRWVDSELEIREDFIGLQSLSTTCPNEIVQVIRDVLPRLEINISQCRGQFYDGASAMSGAKTGVATQIRNLEPWAIYTHCYSHSLNLASQDSVKKLPIMRDTLEITREITKLIKISPRRQDIFDEIKGELNEGSPSIRILCPTRWSTVKADTMKSVVHNYEALQECWNQAMSVTNDTEMKARIIGVQTKMTIFDF